MKIHWKTVMFSAIVAMICGLAISLWGIGYNHMQATILGLIVIMIVCVSWWFWVMFVIRIMMDCTEKTQRGLGEIKYDIREVRIMVRDLDFEQER